MFRPSRRKVRGLYYGPVQRGGREPARSGTGPRYLPFPSAQSEATPWAIKHSIERLLEASERKRLENPPEEVRDKGLRRHEEGFNLTSFDVSVTGETFQFPTKFALFLAFEQESSSIEEAFFFFHKLEAFTP